MENLTREELVTLLFLLQQRLYGEHLGYDGTDRRACIGRLIEKVNTALKGLSE